jgi:hypothetical protein
MSEILLMTVNYAVAFLMMILNGIFAAIVALLPKSQSSSMLKNPAIIFIRFQKIYQKLSAKAIHLRDKLLAMAFIKNSMTLFG